MGLGGRLLGGARAALPFARIAHRVEESAREGGVISVLPGDAAVAETLREVLGVPTTDPLPDEGLVVHAATVAADHESALSLLAARRDAGQTVLVLLLGAPEEQALLERRFLAGHRLEPSNLALLASLEGEDEERARDAVVSKLGTDALPAGRRHDRLRPAVARMLIAQSARRAGAIGASPWPGGADLPVLIVLQVGLVAQLAALYNRPVEPARAVEGLAVAGAGVLWRAMARSVAGLMPSAAWLARGGVAYASTRALGEAAQARLEAGKDVLPPPPAAVRARLDPIFAKLDRT